MKLVFVNRYYFPDISATSQMTTELAQGLAGTHEVHVITSRQRYDDPAARLSKRETVNGVRIHRVWSTRFGRQGLTGRMCDYLSFYLSSFFCLLTMVKKSDTVIAETDPPLICVVAAVAARVKQARLVNWVQDLFPEVSEALGVSRSRSWLIRLLRSWRNAALKSARHNVALSGEMAARIRALGASAEVIPNWADGGHIRPVEVRNNRLRARWGLTDAFVVAYSGNLGRAHDIDTVIRAVEILQKDTRVHFLFIGGGFYWPALQAAAREKKWVRVHFYPYQAESDLAESLSAGDVHLVSIKPEAEGLVVPSKLYGILAAGRPALYIGSPGSEQGHMLEREGAGFGLTAGEPEALAQKLRELAGDLDSVRRMGLNARQAFEKNFDRPVALEAWKKMVGAS